MLLDEFIKGAVFPLEEVKITREEIDAFARKYDPLPFHLDPGAAAQTRFGGIIAPGMLTLAAVWSQWLRTGLYNDVIAGMSAKVNWMRPVYPGDVLRGEIEVEQVLPKDAREGLLTLGLRAANQDGEQVLSARVTALMKR
jgi:acyl dehydratase